MASFKVKTCVSYFHNLQLKSHIRHYGSRWKPKNKVVELEKHVSKYPDVPEFEKLDDDKKLDTFSRQMMIVKSRKEREKNKKFLLEGKYLIKDAISAGISIENIYFNSEDALTGLNLKNLTDLKIQRVTTKDLNLWTDMASCPGIMAVCKTPGLKKSLFPVRQIPVTVICNNVTESENLGAIIRCAAGAGCDRVIATSGCVDVWDSKVLRSGHGAHFHVPIHYNISWSLISNYLPQEYSVILAETNNFEVKDKKFRVKRSRKRVFKEGEEENVPGVDYREKLDDGKVRETAYFDRQKLYEYEMTPLPSHNYTDVSFERDSHVVLVVRGETEGFNAEAYNLKMAAMAALMKIGSKTCYIFKSFRPNLYIDNVRHFKKILKRRPRLILSEEEAREHGYESPFRSPHLSLNATHEVIKDELDPAKPVLLATKKEKFISKYSDVPEYETLGEDDKSFLRIMSLMKSRKEREKKNKILLEGKRLIKDAIDAGVVIESIYFNKEDLLSGLGLKNMAGLNLRKVSYGHLKMWSDLSTSPGIIAVCHKPELGKLAVAKGRIPVTLICDNLREPGNLGAILRCAAAAGCEKVCVDVWDSKVLRGAAGSHFHIPIYNNIDWVSIRNYLPESFSIILAENKRSDDDLPTHNYSDIEFTKDLHVALVVGGETEGVTESAYTLARNNNGLKLTIPLANNVESLNAATASAVILFEICRQINETNDE
uniref:RNA 2-O ribose methyltransferase substrate binding domain-containing protein n=1 Tax=Strigamia maritima TaxID=126957 RepID=T1J6G3_STRMM